MEKKQMYRYVGELSQVFGFKEYRIVGGRADGVRAVDVKNGSGLRFTVFADRCMDIGEFTINGINCAYETKAGQTAPAYYDDAADGWLRSFGGGFLVTCGPDNVGSPGTYNGVSYGLHGRIGNAPAEEFCAKTDYTDDGTPRVVLEGKMRMAWLFGPNVWLTRKITCLYGVNKVFIEDTLENRNFKQQPVMLLYHFNLGYPLLSPDSVFLTSAEYWRAREPFAELSNQRCYAFGEPVADIVEHCFYYRTKSAAAAPDGKNVGALINKRLKTGLAIWSDPAELPCLTNWRSPCEGDYVMGIEPGNCYVEGVEKQEKIYGLEKLEPFGVKCTHIEIEALTTDDFGRVAEQCGQQNAWETPQIYSDLYRK